MKVEYDKDADAAYIYLKEGIKKGEVKKTHALDGNVILDYGKDNRLIGIEVLEASKILTKKAIKA